MVWSFFKFLCAGRSKPNKALTCFMSVDLCEEMYAAAGKHNSANASVFLCKLHIHIH